MASYVFHGNPKMKRGDALMPLNVLKDVYPDIYEYEVAKYKGREKTKEIYIPPLDCYWNDVIMFCLVHPTTILNEWVETGHELNRASPWYKVDAEKLDPSKTTIFLNNKEALDEFEYGEEHFIDFTPENYQKLTYFHEKTRAHYLDYPEKTEKIYLFYFLPHLLYKGSIPFSELEFGEYYATSSLPGT